MKIAEDGRYFCVYECTYCCWFLFDECIHLLYSKHTNVIMQVSCKLASLQDSCRGPFKWSVKDPVLGMTTQYIHGRARKARSARPIQLCGCYTSEG